MKPAKINFNIFTTLMIAISLCAPISNAQNEALSRQISSLQNSFQSYANSVTPRIEYLEAKSLELEKIELKRKACFAMPEEPHIYWPSHGEAQKNGCVRQSDFGKVTCNGKLVNGQNTCAKCVKNGGSPHADPNSPGEFFCKFTGKGSCPSGFTAYLGWRSYASRTCSGGAYGFGCSVGGAPFNDYRYDNLPICIYQICRDTNKGCVNKTCYPAASAVGCY